MTLVTLSVIAVICSGCLLPANLLAEAANNVIFGSDNEENGNQSQDGNDAGGSDAGTNGFDDAGTDGL